MGASGTALTAGLIDEIHLVISPVLLGRGEQLLAGIDTVSQPPMSS
jgi:riboflavin biosynthesis pyrimidine reductase